MDKKQKQNFKSRMKAKIPFGTGAKAELLEYRNKLIAARYYYYFHIKRMREDDVFKLLSEYEFFITPDTIYRLVVSQNDVLNELIKTNASSARLQRLYPQWKW